MDDAIVSALAYAIRNAVWPIDCVNLCFVAKKQYTYLLTYLLTHGTRRGRHFDGGAKLLGKFKFVPFSFFNFYFASHTAINCTDTSTQHPYLMQYLGCVLPA